MQHPHSFGELRFPSILLVFLWTIFTKIVLHVQTYFHIAYIISCFHMVLFLASYGRVRTVLHHSNKIAVCYPDSLDKNIKSLTNQKDK